MCQHHLQCKGPKEADSAREIVFLVAGDGIGRIGNHDGGQEVEHNHRTEVQDKAEETPLLNAAVVPEQPPQYQAKEDEQDHPGRVEPVGPDAVVLPVFFSLVLWWLFWNYRSI